MKDYQYFDRFKKRERALVGPRPASQRLTSSYARAPIHANDAFFVKKKVPKFGH
jgi:hypothetical protein